jgi:hypothetical protein
MPRRLRPSFRAQQAISERTGPKVYAGPFAGMAFASADVPAKYLLGTYELELAPRITSLCRQSFDTIVDVGAEMGYYAVGLALFSPGSRIVAFEADDKFHPSIQELAHINGVGDRLAVRGLCRPGDLAASIKESGRCLVMMDCEGGERLLLDPSAIPELRDCHILVELHDFIFRDVAEIISSRFKKTHKITEIWSRPRTIADFPMPLPGSLRTRLLEKYYVSAMNEGRPEPMRWFYLDPKIVDRQKLSI